MEHIEEIVDINGVDGIFIGPYDLSIGLGKPAQFTDPDFIKAINRIHKACKDAGKFLLAYSNRIICSIITQGLFYFNLGYLQYVTKHTLIQKVVMRIVFYQKSCIN